MTAYLELEKVNVSYDTSQVLFDVSLKVDKGEFIAVAGPSGCGKTTRLGSPRRRTVPDAHCGRKYCLLLGEVSSWGEEASSVSESS